MPNQAVIPPTTKSYAPLMVTYRTFWEIRKLLIDEGFNDMLLDDNTINVDGLTLILEKPKDRVA